MKKKIFAAVVCFAIFVIYQVLGVVLFKWERGGGFLPMSILFTVLAFVWRTITKEKDEIGNENDKTLSDKE